MPNHSQCSITKSFCCPVKRKPVVYLHVFVLSVDGNPPSVIKSKYSLKTYEAIYKILDTFLIFSY